MRNSRLVLLAAVLTAATAASPRPSAASSRTAPPKTTATPARPAQGPVVTAAQLVALKARAIGPAVMGGRVSDLAIDPGDPATFYVGLATGGVMKTVNYGDTFSAIFDKQPVASIGAIAVAPSDPRVVWVATGEADDRNSVSWGNGVYRSTNSGETWTHAGLPDSGAIARLVVQPNDPATAWAAVAGGLWTLGGERGLYKTSDAGKTWKAVLTAPPPAGDRVGCIDVVLHPADPQILFAALYARQRTPWSFTYGPSLTAGKDLGGIFKSTDSGGTWKKLTEGLPSQMGRIGLDVSRSDPKIVFAVVQSDEGGTSNIMDSKSKAGGVFRSEDSGETWVRMSPINPRPFYYSQIRVDPLNPKRIYVLGSMLFVSDDAGKSFREDLFSKVHPDCHALTFSAGANPQAPVSTGSSEPTKPPLSRRLLLGTDGGVYQTYEAGKSWSYLNRMAAGEFYRTSLDMSTPYRICGGLQDNVNWVGPSATRTKDGIVNTDWINVEGGDGFSCAFDPTDRDVVYAESQGGNLHRFNMRTGEQKNLRPAPSEGQPAYRYHWNAPFLASRHKAGTMYLAGNRVFRLTDHGDRSTPISPDLSTEDPKKTTASGSGAEIYGVVYTLAESPIVPGLLWAGTDDGRLWVTDNEGERWTDLSASLPSAAKGQWLSRIEASAHDTKVAYLAVDAHRSGRLSPLAFRTSDRGATWQDISGDLPKDGPVKVLREDPRNANLLFAGTEFGLFASLDRGSSWLKIGALPTVAVDDIAVHPREHDLVIATHGRSLYILDDITPLEELGAEPASSDATLFTPRDAFGSYLLPGTEDWGGKAVFRGENPPEGALISYYVKEASTDQLTISIASSDDQPVASFKPIVAPGIGRVTWDLRPTKEFLTEYGGLGAKTFVKSGDYTVTLTRGQTKVKRKLRVTIAEGIETR